MTTHQAVAMTNGLICGDEAKMGMPVAFLLRWQAIESWDLQQKCSPHEGFVIAVELAFGLL
ncbi:MAG TPA: hypothetical protein VJL88_06715 [Nitrospira sp.]|nr:hypothetical protein [Nitrospira sp.]